MTDDRKWDVMLSHTFGGHGTLVLTLSCALTLYWFDETVPWDSWQGTLRHFSLLHIGVGRIANVTAFEVAIPFVMLIVGWAAAEKIPSSGDTSAVITK